MALRATLVLLAFSASAACSYDAPDGAFSDLPGADASLPEVPQASKPDAATAEGLPDAPAVVPPCGVGHDALCEAGAACAADADCGTAICAQSGPRARTCVLERSCTGGEGAADCRAGSSCCASIPVKAAEIPPFRLDTYLVTAGRFRAFVEATDGNLQLGVAVPPAGWQPEWTAQLPASRDQVDRMLGPGQGTEGCQVGGAVGDYGARTWWTPALEAEVQQNIAAQGVDPADAASIVADATKASLDHKPLNCVNWFAMTAFCNWDGGRLPSPAEWSYAWHGREDDAGVVHMDAFRQYPWPSAAGIIATQDELVLHMNHHIGGNVYGEAAMPFGMTFEADRMHAAFNFGFDGSPDPAKYSYPPQRSYGVNYDNAAHIAPPGSMPAGDGHLGHADPLGNLLEITSEDAGPCTEGELGTYGPGQCAHGKRMYMRKGSWQIHRSYGALPAPYVIGRTYYAMGARCARSL